MLWMVTVLVACDLTVLSAYILDLTSAADEGHATLIQRRVTAQRPARCRTIRCSIRRVLSAQRSSQGKIAADAIGPIGPSTSNLCQQQRTTQETQRFYARLAGRSAVCRSELRSDQRTAGMSRPLSSAAMSKLSRRSGTHRPILYQGRRRSHCKSRGQLRVD